MCLGGECSLLNTCSYATADRISSPSESIIILVTVVLSGILTRGISRRSAAFRSCRFERRGDQIHEVPVFYRSIVAIQEVEETTIAVLTREVGVGLDDVAALLD